MPLFFVGIAAVVADIAVMYGAALSNNSRFLSTELPIFVTGLFVSGGLITTGAILLNIGAKRMIDAMNLWNLHLINKRLPPAERIQYGLLPTRDGVVAALAWRL